jgi:hypothetical protein
MSVRRKMRFRSQDQAAAFETPCSNLGINVISAKPEKDDHDYYPWFIEVEAKSDRMLEAFREFFSWGFECGTGRYGWDEIQQRCNYKASDATFPPLGIRLRRIATTDPDDIRNRPNPSPGSVGKLVGFNGCCMIIQFDGVSYPRKPGDALGDYLFPHEIETEDGSMRFKREGEYASEKIVPA